MNKTKLFGIAIVVFSLTVLNLYGQRREITQEDFYQRFNPMLEKSEKQSRRINFLEEKTGLGMDIKDTTQKVVEIIPPDKIYFNSTLPNTSGNKSETIYIGNTMYHKKIESRGEKLNNIWEMTEGVKPRTLPTFKPANLEGVKWFLTENVVINGQMTDFIECILQKDIKKTSKKTKELEDFIFTGEWKYWINKDNFLIKAEHYQGDNDYLTLTLRLIYEYEYDPNIKIEAPIE